MNIQRIRNTTLLICTIITTLAILTGIGSFYNKPKIDFSQKYHNTATASALSLTQKQTIVGKYFKTVYSSSYLNFQNHTNTNLGKVQLSQTTKKYYVYIQTIVVGSNVYAQSNGESQLLNPDSVTATSGENTTIRILENDQINYKPDADIKIDKAPDNGTVAIKDKALVYKSSESFVGNDYLVYSVCDSADLCTSAPVTISVVIPTKSYILDSIAIPQTYASIEFSTVILSGLMLIVLLFILYSINLYHQEHKTNIALKK